MKPWFAYEVAPAREEGAAVPDTADFGASTVIGITYKDANFRGQTLVWTQLTGCAAENVIPSFAIVNLDTFPHSNIGFNDAISSFRSFNNCETVLFEDPGFGGAATNGGVPVAEMAFVGSAMNEKASSIQWY